MDNPETLATLCMLCTGRRQTKQKTKHTRQKILKMGNTYPTQNQRWTNVLAKLFRCKPVITYYC